MCFFIKKYKKNVYYNYGLYCWHIAKLIYAILTAEYISFCHLCVCCVAYNCFGFSVVRTLFVACV